MPEGTFKVSIGGELFVSEARQAKETGRTYHSFNAFEGKIFVSYLEESEKGPAAIILSLTEEVNIPRPAGASNNANRKNFSKGDGYKPQAKAPAKAPAPKKTEALVPTGDSPW